MAEQLGSFALTIKLNAGDVQRIHAKLLGAKGRITAGLQARNLHLLSLGETILNAEAPQGTDGNWRDGEPKLSQSHHGRPINSNEGILWTDAPHAPFIIFGFAPHMPPEEAWTGDEDLSYPARVAVLDNGTPNQDDYWSRALDKIDAAAQVWPERIGSTVWT